jgi:PKD repeat protein
MSDIPPSVDGITKPAEQVQRPNANTNVVAQKRLKNILVAVGGSLYGIYAIWCIFLLAVLPDTTGRMQWLAPYGTLSATLIGILLLAIGGLGLMRIRQAKNASLSQKKIGVIRIALIIFPGVILSALVPIMIAREPSLGIAITDPDPRDASKFVAPLVVTFDVEHAVSILNQRGLKPEKFEWDLNGDGTINEETVTPTATGIYDRQGGYNIKVLMTLNDGSSRKISRRLTIPQAVFSISPIRPVINEPVRFSVEHLLKGEEQIREVQWDFNGDGEADEVTTEAAVVHTFTQVGSAGVSALLSLSNQTQNLYERELDIYEAEPLPFPIIFVSEPKNLVSPAPFGVLFFLETEETLVDVVWNFGDGEEASGERVGHTFREKGVFRVVAEARTESGVVAKVSTVVRVVDTLRVPDLSFNGSPEIRGGEMQAEVPVTVELTPRTSLPLIEFLWEAPDATSVGSTKEILQAVYRREGTYTITLIAQDPEGRAMRMPITLEVTPPSSMVAIKMTPEGGTAPLLVRFDASETVIPGQDITGFEWLFTDSSGETPQQRGAQVEHMFEEPGTYTITLRAYTTSGEIFEGEKTIVVRAPVLDACFQASRTSGPAPLGVEFNMSCSTGIPTSIEWDFGDNVQSDNEKPIHVFESVGSYTVTLTVQDKSGTLSKDFLTITAEAQ